MSHHIHIIHVYIYISPYPIYIPIIYYLYLAPGDTWGQVKYFMGSLPEGEEGRWTGPRGLLPCRRVVGQYVHLRNTQLAPPLCLLVYKPH